MKELITLNPGLSFSYSGNDNYILQVPSNSDPVVIENGKIYGIVGPNGSGKTTLLNLINGFLKPTVGKITYHDDPPFFLMNKNFSEKDTVWKLSKSKNSMRRSFQIPILPDDLSISTSIKLSKRNDFYENYWNFINPVNLFKSFFAEDQLLEIELSNVLLEIFGFSDSNKLNSTLSFGERRLINLLQLLYSKVKILLLDEPFANIQKENVIKLKQLLTNYVREENNSILLVEHNEENLNDFADIKWVIENKKIIPLKDAFTD